MNEGVIVVALLGLFILGFYKMFTDEHRYTTRVSTIFWPYPIYIGAKEVYRYWSTTSEERRYEEACLNSMSVINISRKARLSYCECMVEKRNKFYCARKVFGISPPAGRGF